jgi:hypothetical protein
MSYSQSSQTQDVVGIYDSNFNQLFIGARPMKARIERKAKLMKQPIESGGTIEDFRVIEPIKITMEVVLNAATYQDDYYQLSQVFEGSNLLNIQTKVTLFPNMALDGIPHEESPAHFDTIKMTLSFEEARIVTTSSSPLPQSAVTKSNGNISGTPASQTQTNQAKATAQNSSFGYNLGHRAGLF